LVYRRIGGLEKPFRGFYHLAFVYRRIGGLENQEGGRDNPRNVYRRIGGLEIALTFAHPVHAVGKFTAA